MRKAVEITIKAVVEIDTDVYDESEIESMAVICFQIENTYSDDELFLPKLEGAEVIEYQETSVRNLYE